jgi:Holliday junction DNA helicase RuvA
VIAFLRGIVVERGADRVVVDVGGVGYLVQISTETLATLPQPGSEARLLTYAHQAQDAPKALFGFAGEDERDLFELLIGVHGVGPKLAQVMIGGLGSPALADAIATGASARLRAVKGVGPKTAERVVLELKGKVRARPRVGAAPAQPSAGVTPVEGEVVRALVGLGYKSTDAEKAVGVAAERTPGAPSADLLREALRQIQAR